MVGSACHVDDAGVDELLEPGLALFAAQPRLLDPSERHVEPQVEMLVDPDRAGLDPARDGRRLV
jgi:hypothetical protein